MTVIAILVEYVLSGNEASGAFGRAQSIPGIDRALASHDVKAISGMIEKIQTAARQRYYNRQDEDAVQLADQNEFTLPSEKSAVRNACIVICVSALFFHFF